MHRLLRIAIALMGLLAPPACLAADPSPRPVLVLSQGSPGALGLAADEQAIRSVVNSNNFAAPASIYVEELVEARAA